MKKNNAETTFHQSRKAFVILENDILISPEGFSGSHFELLCQNGFDAKQAKEVISKQPRGFARDGSVYLYQGEDFSCLSEECEKKCSEWLLFFQKSGWLSSEGKIYNGMRVGKIGEVWTPVKEFKISF